MRVRDPTIFDIRDRTHRSICKEGLEGAYLRIADSLCCEDAVDTVPKLQVVQVSLIVLAGT